MASQQIYAEFELNYEIPERRFVGIQNILLSKSKLYLTSQFKTICILSKMPTS